MMFVRMVVAVFAGVVVSASGAFAEPEVFSDAGFAVDQVTALENEKLHVIYFTASWCGPCKRMKKTTWVDESLVSWLDENAVVSAVDVDEYQELSQDYFVSAMPTIAVYRGDDEVARAVGYRGAVELKDWLERAERGEIENEYLAQIESDKLAQQIASQMQTGHSLFQDGDLGGAAEQYLSIWNAAHAEGVALYLPDTIGLTDLFCPRLLCDQQPETKRLFVELRDAYQRQLESGDVTWELLADWVALNYVVKDADATIRWMERKPEVVKELSLLSKLRLLCEHELVVAGRYDVFAKITDANQRARAMLELNAISEFASASLVDHGLRDEVDGTMSEALLDDLSLCYSLALLEEDSEGAEFIADMAEERFDETTVLTAFRAMADEVGVELLDRHQ